MDAPHHVLIVEDEMMLAMMVEDVLSAEGYSVTTAASHAAALAAIDKCDMDVAVLDINLGSHSALPLADELVNRGVPVVFASGYGATGLPDRFRGCTVLQKPYLPSELVSCVSALLA